MTEPPVAMILAAGRGSRLGSLTRQGTAKPMLPIGDAPLIDRIARDLRVGGVRRLLVNAHHGATELVEHFAKATHDGSVEIRREAKLSGPAGSLLTFADILWGEECFLVVSGDAVIDIDYAALLDFHRGTESPLTIVAKTVREARRFDALEVDEQGRIVAFRQRPHDVESALISCGVYVISREALACLQPDTESDYADVYRSLTRLGASVYAYPHHGYWNDIGAPRALWAANLSWVGGELRDSHSEGTVWVAPAAEVGPGARLAGRVTVGAGAKVSPTASLEDTVVLPGACVPEGAELKSCLVSQQETWCFEQM